MAAAGIEGVVRYVGVGSVGKRLTAAELADLTAHGRQVRGVVESTTTRADAGRTAVVADAQAALADPVTASLPYLYMTNDKSTFVQADVDYMAGFESVLGDRAGAYGFGNFLLALIDAGLGHSYWQAGPAPSRTGTTGKVHFWQRQGGAVQSTDGPTSPTTLVIGGVSCDVNNRLMEETSMAAGWAQSDTDALMTSTVTATSPTGQVVALPFGTWLTNIRFHQNDAENAQLTAIAGQLTSEQAALVAAIAAAPAGGGITDAQLAAVQDALLAALPAYTVSITPKTS